MVLGIVILIIGYLYFASFKEPDKGIIQTATRSQPINLFVESCIENMAKKGIYFIALQGGYYDAPQLSVPFLNANVPFYWHNKESKVPEKQVIEKDLSKYIKNNLPECINDFKSFEELGFRINAGEPKIKSTIAEKNVVVDVEYPIRVSSDSGSINLDKFTSTIDLRLNDAYKFSNQIVEEQKKTPDSIPIGFITDLSYNNDFTFEIINLQNDEVIYSLVLPKEGNDDLIYSFAAKYDWSNIKTENSLVSIEPISDINLDKPATVRHEVKAVGEDLTFYDNSDLFDIDSKTGLIGFDASYLSNGKRTVVIKAVDKYGNQDFAFFNINVKYPNQLPVIQEIGKLTAYAGKEFYYKVNANDPTLEFLLFLDDASLFNIHPQTGEIRFTPPLKGTYNIKITAVNSAGHSSAFMKLEVK